MYFYAILPFALLLWWPENRPFSDLLIAKTSSSTLFVVLGQLVLLFLAGSILHTVTNRRLKRNPLQLPAMQMLHHTGAILLRGAAVLMFAVDLFCTKWVDWVRSIPGLDVGWALDEMVILSPFFAGVILGWLTLYPTETLFRTHLNEQRLWEGNPPKPAWSLFGYLIFHLRHQLLIIAVPMTVILIVQDVTRRADGWIAYSALTAAAAAVFLTAPLMMRYVWSTQRLPNGPLRTRLDELSRRIGLRFQDILVWQSDGMMVNAAVMGLTPRLRYVLLSDGLLETMSEPQIEAVFGHEAGHIRHHHIFYFVLFATIGALIVSGMMEGLLRLSSVGGVELNMDRISVIGFLATVAIWGLGFGWLSRRFEGQADIFGAQCASPSTAQACGQPCSVHNEHPPLRKEQSGDRLCASGALIFSSALQRVAALNGIPYRERSWRHSSIAYRLHRLAKWAGDPAGAVRFQSGLRALKMLLIVGSFLGLVCSAVYICLHPAYRAELNLPFL